MKTQTFTNANTAFKAAYQCTKEGTVCKLSRDSGVWTLEVVK